MYVVLAGVVIFIYGMLASMLGTIVPSLGSRLGLTNLQISYLALSQGIGLAVTSVWAGAFMDRRGKKLGLILGLCTSIAGLEVLSHPRNLTFSILAMALLGAGGSLVIVGANALVNEFSGKRKASALNILNVFVGLGGMATPFVAGNLLHSDPMKVAYSGEAIAVVALLLTVSTAIPRSVCQQEDDRSVTIFREKAIYVLSTITFLYTACEFAMWNWLPKFLIAAGIPVVTALDILSLGFACGMLFGRLAAAKVLVEVPSFTVTLVASVSMGVTTFAMLHVSTPRAFACLVFAIGVAMAPIFPTTIAIIGNIHRQRAATAIGFAITCGFTGLVLSSPLIGTLAGTNPHGVGRALLLIPLLSALIAIILIVFRKQLDREALMILTHAN